MGAKHIMMRYAGNMMKRTMIVIPDELDIRLRFEAERRGVSVAEVSRAALDAYLAPVMQPGPLGFFGVGEGSPDDVSERVDEVVNAAISRRRRG